MEEIKNLHRVHDKRVEAFFIPVEKLLRDVRLASIWTGTSEIMNLIIQHDYFQSIKQHPPTFRDIESDAPEAGANDEKIYE